MVDALSDRILASLKEKPRSISEIARELDEEKYQVSKKIEVLEEQGSINTYKIGRSTACLLADEMVGHADGEEDVAAEAEEASEEAPEAVDDDREGMPRTIGIVSGKGGVGKTALTLNIGVALMERGEKVIVMDADAEMPNVGIQLGIHAPPTSLQQVVEQDVHIMSAMHIDKDSGLRVIPTSLASEPPEAAVREAIGMLPGDYTVLVDAPPGYQRPLDRVIETCDELVFVTTPELPALADTYKLYHEAVERGKQVAGVVVNMYSSSKNHLSLTEVEEALDLPVIGTVNHSGLVPRSIMENQPLVTMKPYAKPSRQFKQIAASLTGERYESSLVDRVRGFLP